MSQREPEQTYAASKPRKGDVLTYNGDRIGTVWRVEGALCWINYDDGHDPLPFIWCFRDTLNVLFDWPTKAPGEKTADWKWRAAA